MRAPVVFAIFFLLLTAVPAFAQSSGSITGIVTSSNNAAVPGATVTLWAIVDNISAQAAISNNPQFTSNFSSSLPGTYAFTNVPPGRYNITASWGGHSFYNEVNLTGGTVTANVVIPEYIDVLAIKEATPIPTPKSYYTYVPVRVSSPLPQATTKSPGFEGLMIVIAIPIAVLARKRLQG
jgi:hypothetical protein